MKRKTFKGLTILSAGLGIVLLGGLSFVGIKSQGFKNWDVQNWLPKKQAPLLLELKDSKFHTATFFIKATDERIDRSSWELRDGLAEEQDNFIVDYTITDADDFASEKVVYGLKEGSKIVLPIYVDNTMDFEFYVCCKSSSTGTGQYHIVSAFDVEVDGELQEFDIECSNHFYDVGGTPGTFEIGRHEITLTVKDEYLYISYFEFFLMNHLDL